MSQYRTLRKFKPEALLLDDEETIIVLKFIFKPVDHLIIDQLPMTNALKEFAQGLLVEAIDASYAIGFVESLFRATATPSNGAMKVIKRFSRRAASHWFKHANVHDLSQVKIYEFIVKDRLATQFRSSLHLNFSSNNISDTRIGAFLDYKITQTSYLRFWS